jgi:predicted O-linked N-acetylglucosamine transferase (SPINDLY family)
MLNALTHLNRAIRAHASGSLEDAEYFYKKTLIEDPQNATALGWLGVIEAQRKNYDVAKDLLLKALAKEKNNQDFLLNYANLLSENKEFCDAIKYYQKAIRQRPNDPICFANLAACYNEQSNPLLGLGAADQSIQLKPDYAEGWSNRGNALQGLRRYEEALASHERALELKPDYAEAWGNRGNDLQNLRRYEEALASHERALELKPDYAEAWSNHGNALQELRRYEEALASHERALELKPDYAEAWSNRGNALQELRRYEEALASHERALELKPDYAEGWSNKGNTLHELKRFNEAIAHNDRALSLKPDFAEAHYNKGIVLNELKQYDETIVHYDKALGLKPDINWVSGDLLHTKMKICSWSDLSESLGDIYKKVGASEKVNPFPLLALVDDALLHKQSAEIYVRYKCPFNPILGVILKQPKNEKIRIGYFSPDFKNHPVAFLIAELFEIHDRSQFEIYAFSLLNTADDIGARLKLAFDHFIEVEDKSDIEIAQLSRGLNIDIAVDLTGITNSSRTGIFSYRAAPIQVNYLGYPGTMGTDYIDYIIADTTLIPLDSQAYYSEKVVYLPNSYQVNDRRRLISDRQFTKQELGLPENGFVFCCFNNNYKILPATFDGWMRILLAVEGSVLWLLQDNSWVVDNLKKEAQKRGIDAQRLVFADRVPLSEHLARHRQADLFLDTLPYNAHTTTSDALWSGLPVLTLMGRSFASRVTASLLSAIGLPKLITKTQEEYEALAIDLAMNPNNLTDIKNKLAKNRLTTPLFDTPLFTKNIEAAYIKMYEFYHDNLEPDHITIV